VMRVRAQWARGRPARRVVVGTEVAARLVDRPVDVLLGPDRVVVDVDGDFLRVDASTQVADDFAVDLDAAAGDQVVAVAARPGPARGQAVVQPEQGRGMVPGKAQGGTALGFTAEAA